jgi:hypothetical protein
LSDEVGSPDDLENFIVVLADEGKLESVLGRIDSDSSGLSAPVKTVNDVALDSSEVDRLLKGLDNAVITTSQLPRSTDSG